MGTALFFLAAILSAAPPAPPRPTPAPPGTPPSPRPPAAPPVLQGVVKGPDGRPLEKALVLARPAVSSWQEPAATALTDATGAFRLPLKGRGPVTVRVEARGLAGRTLERVSPSAPLTVVLQKGGVLEGTVKDGASGQPVRGAHVKARLESAIPGPAWEAEAGAIDAVADAKGAFRLEGVGPGPHWIQVAARGYGPLGRVMGLAGRRLELFLFPGAGIRGVVRGPGDEPVAGAAVRAEAGRPSRSTAGRWTTNAAGRFEAAGLPPGLYRLVVHHKDWAVAVVGGLVLERSGDLDLDVRLERPGRVSGRLVDAEERPLAGRVFVQELSGEGPLSPVSELLGADAGPDGRFLLDRLPSGAHGLTAQAPGHAQKRVDIEVSRGEAVVDLGDVVLDEGSAIRGRVRDTSGAGIAGAAVSCSPFRSRGASVETTSEADGSFVAAGLRGGTYRVHVRAAGFGHVLKTASVAETLEIVLEPAASITGTVVDEVGRSVESFQVEATSVPPELGRVWHGPGATTVADGRFTLHDLTAGDYVLEITAPGLGRGVAGPLKVATGTTADAGRVVLKAGGTVRGQVVDSDGAALPGAIVWGRSTQSFPGGSTSGTSDGTGRFEIRGMIPGPASVSASHPGFAPGQVTDVEVVPGRPVEVRIVLTQGGRIEGSARGRGNRPIAGATVHARPDVRLMTGPLEAITAADGSFRLEHLPAGRLRVDLGARDDATASSKAFTRDVEVREGQATTVDFLAREVVLSGRITRGGAPLPGVHVKLRGDGADRFFGNMDPVLPPGPGRQRMSALSRADGRYEMLVDEPGRFFAVFDSPDARTLPDRPIVVPDGEATSLDFDFSGILLSGVVVDRDTEQPVANASLSASRRSQAPSLGLATTGSDGRFQLEVEPGDYHLIARADGYGRAMQWANVGTSGLSDVRVVLARGLSLGGRIVDTNGQRAGNVEINATAADGSGRGGPYARSLPDGTFEVPGLEAVPYTVLAGTPGGPTFAFAGPVNPAETVLLRLRPAGQVRVTVVGPDGRPVEQVRVGATTLDGQRLARDVGTKTDSTGTAEFTAPPGTLGLQVHAGALSGTATVLVPEGGAATAEIRLVERRTPPPR
jgi:hypothetical protein